LFVIIQKKKKKKERVYLDLISEMIERFRQVVRFASNTVDCRHKQILAHFEEGQLENHPLYPTCCDNCSSTSTRSLKEDAALVVRLVDKIGGSPLISLVCHVLIAKVMLFFV